MGAKLIRRLILLITLIISGLFLDSYKHAYILHGDTLGYYLYLPTTFIYQSHKSITELPADRQIDPAVIASLVNLKRLNQPTPKGYVLNQYTYGVALLETPFFFLAHAYEKARGLPANGYSWTYQYALKLCTLFYTFLGLLLVYKILRRYYTPTDSLLGVVLLFLGTNLFWFTLHQVGMAHNLLFLEYAALIYFTIRLHERPGALLFAAVGFVAGLITITRPTDIICLLIPLLYNLYDKPSLRAKLQMLKDHWPKIILGAATFVLPVIPQMLYWKMLSGSYVYYSYGEQQFFWNSPKIIEGLFYPTNGWLAYSPLMIFSIVGIFLYRRIKTWAWCLWILFPAYVYIIYSWYCYNYINGLGSRPMIHLYPLLAIPLTAFIAMLRERAMWLKVTGGAVIVLLTAVSLSYCIQQAKGLLNTPDSNIVFNMQTLFKMRLLYNDMVTYDIATVQPDKATVTKVASLGRLNFDDSLSDRYRPEPANPGGHFYEMHEDEYLPDVLSAVYSSKYGARWIRCAGRFMYYNCPSTIRHRIVLEIKRGDQAIKAYYVDIDNKIGAPYYRSDKEVVRLDHCRENIWDEVFFFVKLPPQLRDGDVVRCFPWNAPRINLCVDDLSIELYK
ncbi:MAG: glycosyltransferase family 39 protein [Bacteroidota bacterium]